VTAAFIAGASTGIGRELARLFAADGVDLVVVSSERSVAELSALADELRSRHGVRVDTITMDLARPGAGATW
jgi:short-subunit dehydrogenase